MEIVKDEQNTNEVHNLASLGLLERSVTENKTIEQIREELEKNLVLVGDALNGFSKDELTSTEQELMELFKANDEYLKNRTYQLAPDTNFDSRVYTVNEITKMLDNFLGQLEVDFKTSLGIYQAIGFWRSFHAEQPIPYAVLDTTLRLLGLLKFKGYSSLRNILVINQWISGAHLDLMRDMIWTEYLHTIHNAMLQILNPQPEPQQVQN